MLYDIFRMTTEDENAQISAEAGLAVPERVLTFINVRNPRTQLILAIVIFVLPAVVAAIGMLISPQAQPSLMWTGVSMIGTNLGAIAAMLLLIAATGSSLSEFGINRDHPFQDIVTGLVWTVPQFWLPGAIIGTIAAIPALQQFDAAVSPPTPAEYKGNTLAWSVYILGLVSNSCAEELAIRGVIFTRIRLISGSVAQAVIWSSLLFASYHIYQGPLAAMHVFISGILFCLAFIIHRSIWVGIITHTAVNVLIHVLYY